MAPVRFRSSAALLCLICSHCADATPTATRVNCLGDLNEYRREIGFANFTAAETLPVSSDVGTGQRDRNAEIFWESVCEGIPLALKLGQQFSPPRGTSAVFPHTGPRENCADAVEYWKIAFKNFVGLPPQFKEGAKPYDSERNISFVALSNPKGNPTIDCAYIACPKKETPPTVYVWPENQVDSTPPGKPPDKDPSTGKRREQRTPKDAEEGDAEMISEEGSSEEGIKEGEQWPRSPVVGPGEERSHLEDRTEDGSASGTLPWTDVGMVPPSPKERRLSPAEGSRILFCMSNPPVLETGKRPFSAEEWQMITQALGNFASGSAPALPTLAATALGIILW